MIQNFKSPENQFSRIIEETEKKDNHYYIKSSSSANIFSLPIAMVYLTLPYKSIDEISWTKAINDYKLSITSGINDSTGKPYGIPYGAFARKLIYLTCTLASKTQSPTINLGKSYTDAFKKLGIIDKLNGKEKRADGRTINLFKDQILRLFFSRIGLSADKKTLSGEYHSRQALNLAKGMEFFTTNDDKFDFNITLTNDFFEYIMNTKLIPFDYDVLSALDNSPMLMDLYIFLNYKAFSANYSRRDIFVSYEELYQAFGTTSSLKHFKSNIKTNLKKLIQVHKSLLALDNAVRNGKDGILIAKESVSSVVSKEEQLILFADNSG